MTVKSSISLTDSQYDLVKGLVEDGRYASVSAVLQQGLEALWVTMESASLERAALKALLEQRAARPFLEQADFESRLQEMLAGKMAENGVRD